MDLIVCLTNVSTNCAVSENSKSFVLWIKWERPTFTKQNCKYWSCFLQRETHKPGVGRDHKTKPSDGPQVTGEWGDPAGKPHSCFSPQWFRTSFRRSSSTAHDAPRSSPCPPLPPHSHLLPPTQDERPAVPRPC